MKPQIALIDFGAGNLHSVYKALKFIGADVEITKDINKIENSDAVVFPGVGAFGAVMSSIRKNNLEDVIKNAATSTKPFLGICVGMQVLFEEGEENPGVKGLGILKGKVVKFKKAKKIPHVGWNDILPVGGVPGPRVLVTGPRVLVPGPRVLVPGPRVLVPGPRVLVPGPRVQGKYYFVHSYYVVPEDKNIIDGETEYDGEIFTSIIKKDNLTAVQFHPEKSGDAGLELLKHFKEQG